MKDHLHTLIRRWPLILVCGLIGFLIPTVQSVTAPSTYRATVRMFVATAAQDVNSANQGTLAAESRVKTYQTVAMGQEVLTQAANRSGEKVTAGQLASMVSVTTTPGTVLLDITATAGTPDVAAHLAQAVSDQLVVVVSDAEKPLGGGQQSLGLLVLQPAAAGIQRVPTFDVAKVGMQTGIGLVFGAVLALIVPARFRFRLRRKKSEAEPEAPNRPEADDQPTQVISIVRAGRHDGRLGGNPVSGLTGGPNPNRAAGQGNRMRGQRVHERHNRMGALRGVDGLEGAHQNGHNGHRRFGQSAVGPVPAEQPAPAHRSPITPHKPAHEAVEPVAVEPAVVEPAVVGSADVKPGVDEPGVVEPGVVEAAAVEPAGVEAASVEPAVVQLVPSEPAAVTPVVESVEPEAATDEPEGAVDEGEGAVDEPEGAVDDAEGAVDEGEGAVDGDEGAVDEAEGAVDEFDSLDGASVWQLPEETIIHPIAVGQNTVSMFPEKVNSTRMNGNHISGNTNGNHVNGTHVTWRGTR